MKLYTRVGGGLVGTPFRHSLEHSGYSEIFWEGRWQRSGWTNDELLDKHCFKVMGNNFKLK